MKLLTRSKAVVGKNMWIGSDCKVFFCCFKSMS